MTAEIFENFRNTGFRTHVFELVALVLVGFVAVFFWSLAFKKKRRRKRKHHGHDRINPTLAQVGGLPPVRAEDAPRCDPPPVDPLA
jgi:hypothetical protein